MPRTRRNRATKRQAAKKSTAAKKVAIEDNCLPKNKKNKKSNVLVDETTTTTTSIDKNDTKSSVCEMKGFDSFGSDCGTLPSSGSGSSLFDSFEREKHRNERSSSSSSSNEKAPQCLQRRKSESNIDGPRTQDDDEEEIQFSFRPHIRCSSPSSEGSSDSSSGGSSTESRKRTTMYLSRRMSYKLTRPDLSPIKSPKIRAKRLVFSPTTNLSEVCSAQSVAKKSKQEQGKIVKLSRRYSKAKKR